MARRPLRDLLALAGASRGLGDGGSLQRPGAVYATSEVDPGQIADPDPLLAFELNGAPLHIDHGFPIRLIGPNRPGCSRRNGSQGWW